MEPQLISLTPVVAESGYIRSLIGFSNWAGFFPADTSRSRFVLGVPSEEARGFLSFDAGEIPDGGIVFSARLRVPSITTLGTATAWGLGGYIGATYDDGDLEASFESGIYATTFEESPADDPPTEIDWMIPKGSIPDLIVGERIVFQFREASSPPNVSRQWDPVVATATLELWVQTTEVSISTPADLGVAASTPADGDVEADTAAVEEIAASTPADGDVEADTAAVQEILLETEAAAEIAPDTEAAAEIARETEADGDLETSTSADGDLEASTPAVEDSSVSAPADVSLEFTTLAPGTEA